MYPRNAGTPPRIAVGPVVLIADGTVQTSAVTVSVTPEGGAAAGSAGTISYVEGIVHYAPTQAETNYTAFTVVAYKADCIPAAVTVITTASATAGIAIVPDTQKVDVNTWLTGTPAALADTDKLQVSVQHKLSTLDLTDTEKQAIIALVGGGIH